MGKRRNSSSGPEQVMGEPSKRLNHSFHDLMNTERFKEFEVLTSDNFWEDSSSVNKMSTNLNSEDRRALFGDDALDPQVNQSDIVPFDGKHIVEQYSFVDYFDVDLGNVPIRDYYKYDYPTCISLKSLLVERQVSISFSEFSFAFLKCILTERVEQARIVFLAYIECNGEPKVKVNELEAFFSTVIRVALDNAFDYLLTDLAVLCERLKLDELPETVINNCVDQQLFISYPYRAIVVGNFLRLFSPRLARLFYDHLLIGHQIVSFYEFFETELGKEVEDHLKLTERLLLCYIRLTVTDEKLKSSSDLLKCLRHLKGKLPMAMIGSVVDIQNILTKISCFLIANERKQRST